MRFWYLSHCQATNVNCEKRQVVIYFITWPLIKVQNPKLILLFFNQNNMMVLWAPKVYAVGTLKNCLNKAALWAPNIYIKTDR